MDVGFGNVQGVDMSLNECECKATPRREFLSQLSLALAGSALALGATSGSMESSPGAGDSASLLPTIPLGEHRVTRLIVGSNPIHGYSYMGPAMDREMREYFTEERTTEFLWQCERAGIDTHQFSSPEKMVGTFRALRHRGSEMKFICLHAGGSGSTSIDQVVRDTQPIAIAHHGGVTDRLFRGGQSGEVHDFVKRVHDAGVLAGVSAHNPDCIKRIADEGWKVDFFMTCFYYLTRTPEELKNMPPVDTLGSGYSFFPSDPVIMTKVMQQVGPPCLGFKILGAGRKCRDKQMVEEAFKFAFEHIKPTDGVIVGMYPRHTDQVRENAEHTQDCGKQRRASHESGNL
jgi:hypothetical protein